MKILRDLIDLDKYQKQLITFMLHHIHKTYLNAQLLATFAQFNFDEALIIVNIVNYEMHINPKKAKETKDKWFGKCEWTLHSILLYTKDQNTNNINVNTFNH
ncbi:hypothetical protein RhiirA5_436845 [Rhizophagus irregularis]|uniref:Uncharacterized protein n=1 Tax=Rhizophagus irregularis TaxID=588596 RepID=A0A2N0NLB6_9GLOM|nr:hypothetical protein RhiirA5_436845 [Rhizophagus irregularis]GET52592.1 hypothetical protein GLOIN_2v1790442 [Rhizophagus irregularis DAOM 181602=DAOM 197198]